jgi:pantoate--beta-alanine ligase
MFYCAWRWQDAYTAKLVAHGAETMEVVTTIQEVRRLLQAARQAGQAIALVPTMGALHQGHASLIDAAAADGSFVVVSIFVNPTQFGPTEDLARYPRTGLQDIELCRQHSAGMVFMPTVEEMYPPGENFTQVSISKLGGGLCGASRAGHFTGVCTVVAKFFNIAQPDKAYFGAKDFQQATIIRQMTTDLNFPVQIVVCPTVRQSDGLAMSSRNTFLSPEHRRQAVALSASLKLAGEMIRKSHPPAAEVAGAIRRHIAEHAHDGVIDYIEVVDPLHLAKACDTDKPVCIALAVKFAATRLIDNIVVE